MSSILSPPSPSPYLHLSLIKIITNNFSLSLQCRWHSFSPTFLPFFLSSSAFINLIPHHSCTILVFLPLSACHYPIKSHTALPLPPPTPLLSSLLFHLYFFPPSLFHHNSKNSSLTFSHFPAHTLFSYLHTLYPNAIHGLEHGTNVWFFDWLSATSQQLCPSLSSRHKVFDGKVVHT